ncbi:MAG: methyltransferase, partial [Miltoncostaeaceae bacterium]
YALPFAASGWDVTVLDLPDAIEVLGDDLAAAGVAALGGDLLAGLPGGPWDAVYVGNVTHLFDAEVARDLVRRAGEAVRPGGTLAVQEVVRGLSTPGHLFAVTMLLSTDGGDTHTEADYRAWMGEAGCPVQRVVELSGGDHHLFLGARAA